MPQRTVELGSVAVLFVAIVALVLVLIGVVERGTTALLVIPPTLLGCFAILRLRR